MAITKLINEDKFLRSLHHHLTQVTFSSSASSTQRVHFSTIFSNSDEYTKVILKNAAHIGRFYFRGCPNPATFLLFFSPCRNLRSFDCHLEYELPQDVFACLNIVEQNQGLISFFIDGIPIKRLGVAQKFLQVLSQHTGLKRLEFKSADSKLSEHLFKAILQSVPSTLNTLNLKWLNEIQDNNDFEFRGHHVILPGWTNNGIKTLELNRALTGYEHSVVTPFLRHCVRLGNFRPPPQLPVEYGPVLTETLREHCPSLRCVLISNQDHDSVIALVVNGSRALNEFRIRYSADIQMILSHCPGLRTFTVEDWQEDGHKSLLEIKDMVSSLWVCLGLRDLTLPIGSDYGVDTEAQDEERDRLRQEVITKAYRQFGALTELRTLSFGSQVPQENNTQFSMDLEGRRDFDMTLASGLDHLKDLKKLRRFDVAALRHRMREKELQWIDENWPALRDLRGIYMYEGDELSEEEEMEEVSEKEEVEEELEEGKAVAEEEEDGEDFLEGDVGDQLENNEPELEPILKPEPEGKMTRHHVSWFFGKRPYAELY
ncbi:hypothetical protein BGZ47_007758 [Haplosporangium gracile]|nr:hypothetical protein BGZ47_007758 [Haplosporangium gracile]